MLQLNPSRGTVCLLLLSMAGVSWAQVADPPVDVSPSDAAAPQAEKPFEIFPGFQMNIAAPAPVVQHPVAIAFDPMGRMFAAETSPDESGGLVRLLQDTDGNGVFETSSLFMEVPGIPYAVAAWGQGAFVQTESGIWFGMDFDGDTQAERVERIFTAGASEAPDDPRTLPFLWGLDNRFHGQAPGPEATLRRTDSPNAKPLSLDGVGFSFDPRHRQIQAASGYGPRGMAYDTWGRTFVASNESPLRIVLPGGESGHDQPNIGEEDLGAVGGLFVYQGDAWPATFQDNLFLLRASDGLLLRMEFDYTGILPKAFASEFVKASGASFHPVQAVGGPDGNVYLVDYGAAGAGQIYRLSPGGHVQETRPMPGAASPEELVAMLGHRNAWHAETAARIIYETRLSDAAPALETFARSADSASGRLRALWALEGLGLLGANTLAVALTDGEAPVRLQALRLSAPFLNVDATITNRVLALVDDPEPWLRYEAIAQLGNLWRERRTDPLVRACLRDGKDPVFQHALLGAGKDVAQDLLLKLAAEPEFCGATENAPLLHGLARLSVLSRTANNTFVASIFDTVPENLHDSRMQLASGFATGATGSGQWRLLQGLMASGSLPHTLVDHLLDAAHAAAADTALPLADRLHAIGLLSVETYENVGEILTALINQKESAEVQLAAVQSLCRIGNPKAVPDILALWPSLGPQSRQEVMFTGFQKGVFQLALLDAIESGAADAATLAPWGLRDLERNANPIIRARAKELLAGTGRKDIEALQEMLVSIKRLTPSPENGKLQFEKNCSMCHHFDNLGTAVGPDINFRAQAGDFSILKKIMDPNADATPFYYSYNVETEDFETFTGIIAAEGEDEIEIRGPGGEMNTVAREAIATVECSEKTLMPSGWQEALGEQGIVDLIEYLVSTARKAALAR